MRRLFLGIDVSTTGAKALLIDEKGAVVASATTPLALSTPKPLWSEQDPREWWSGTTASIRRALAEAGAGAADVATVGLTGQMHGLVLLDGAREVLRPAILWNDQRTGAQCDAIRERMGGRARLVKETGNDALTGFTAPKILWVREHEPAVYAKARLVLLPKDYVRLRLTDVAAMDKADGSGTLLFDLGRRGWSQEVLDKLEIPAEWLPPTYEGPEVTGRVTASAAAATGLREGTPVVAGGGDQAAGAVGAGAVRPGVVALTLGTSGVVFVTTDKPLVEPEGRLHAFCHAVPGKWHFMGVTLSAAGSLQWYHDTLAGTESFDALVDEAGQAPAGRRPRVPALPLRRAHALSRPAGPRVLRRPDRPASPGPPDPLGARGRGFQHARLLRPAEDGRGRRRPPGARRGGRGQERALAAHLRQRPRR